MEKNEKSPKLHLRKSPWKSPSKQRSSETPEKPLHLNFESSSPKERNKQQFKRDHGESSSVVSPPSKKRKRNVTPTEGLDEMLEEEIEKQWDKKAEKNNLTVLNVKNILKSVITNKYVVDMVRQTIEKGNFSDMPFEPKFTRAKKKELLQQLPDAPLPPVVGLLTPLKPPITNINPEMKLLIADELHEDSSDEEYNPDNEVLEQSDDDESRGETSFLSDADSMPPTPGSLQAPPTPSQDCSQDGSFKVPQENVGQRTRSKLDLNRLAVESLEQMFVPPDIPEDMLEEECDNPDWQEFLQEFAQPMCHNETMEDDIENDPEYNLLADEVNLKVDREEMRKDKAVKVSRKELNVLMKELFEYTDMAGSDNDLDQTTESLAELEASIMQETEERQKREEFEMENVKKLEEIKKQEDIKIRKSEIKGMVPTQKLLLAQQMRQHVQLTTQHFLQTFKHPIYHYYSGICRTMLTTLTGLTTDKVFSQPIVNLEAAVETVDKWEYLHSQPDTGEKIRKFVKEQLTLEKVRRKSKRNTHMNFPKELMQTTVESEAFIYPSLLPSAPFRTTFNMAGPNSFTHNEDMLIAISLEQVTKLMEERKRKYKQRRLIDKAGLIYNASIPRCSPHYIARRISMQTCSKTINPIRCFMKTGKVPTIVHCVTHVQGGVKLCHRPLQQFPETWKAFLNNQNTEPSSSKSSRKSTSTSSLCEKPSKTITTGFTQHLNKIQEPSQDLTFIASSKTNSPKKNLTVESGNSSEKGTFNSKKSNTGSKSSCDISVVCSISSNLKKSLISKSSKPLENHVTSTKSSNKKSPITSNRGIISSDITNSKCNGQLPLSFYNKRDEREGFAERPFVKSINCISKVNFSHEPIDSSIICSTSVKKSVSKCKVQSANITNLIESSLESNLPKKQNLFDFGFQKTTKSLVNININEKEHFLKSLPILVDEKSPAKPPNKSKTFKKKVSFHLENVKKDRTKCSSHEENIEKQSHTPRMKFSVKFQNNTLGCHLKQSKYKLVKSQTSSVTEFSKDSGLGLLKNCCESFDENKKSDKSEDYKTKSCNSTVSSLISPTKTISHKPKPPSTVKLKKF